MNSLAKILLPVDFSERSALAVRYAGDLALQFHSELILAHVLPPLHSEFGTQITGSMLVDVYRTRTDQAEQATSTPSNPGRWPDSRFAASCCMATRRPKSSSWPAQEHVDLIAMPTHGYGPFRRFILGSNTAKVLHDADCPVWTGVHIEEATSPWPQPFSKILCAVDLGPQSARALAWASLAAAGIPRAPHPDPRHRRACRGAR